MTTLATLKSTIADDLVRTDLTAQISAAIDEAITYYAASRFYFAETTLVAFETEVDEREYTHDLMEFDNGSEQVIPVRIEAVIAVVNGQNFQLERIDPLEMEMLHDTTVASGQPQNWSYTGSGVFSLYPLPDDEYTIRLLGLFRRGPPETDAETGNVWMTDAFELIRCRAKFYLAVHTTQDADMATAMAQLEMVAKDRLIRETALRSSTGRIIPTGF
jgi:hypothetical protein